MYGVPIPAMPPDPPSRAVIGASGFAEIAGVSRETLDRLRAYVALLERWQQRINLVSSRTLRDVWRRHILDSWQLVPHLPADAEVVLDLGAGAGLPGLVIAAARTDLEMHLVEADGRKCVFLREASRLLDARVTVHHMRIGQATLPKVPVVVARALAPLTDLLDYAAPLLATPGICLFHKGARWAEELDDAKRRWMVDADPLQSMTDPDARILRIPAPIAPRT